MVDERHSFVVVSDVFLSAIGFPWRNRPFLSLILGKQEAITSVGVRRAVVGVNSCDSSVGDGSVCWRAASIAVYVSLLMGTHGSFGCVSGWESDIIIGWSNDCCNWQVSRRFGLSKLLIVVDVDVMTVYVVSCEIFPDCESNDSITFGGEFVGFSGSLREGL